ncbi:MAG: hypothetical protein PHP04_13895 [Bacteroidales bacterium]|nr:hypothetical protein [Bacteroidales bacterium]
MKKLLLFLLLVTAVGQNHANAGTIDFTTVDALSYRYYLEQKWDSVIYIGKMALNQNIDYYYLRVRMGLAYFARNEYIPASVHLKKARLADPADPVIAEYLYYSYRYTNRDEEARLLEPSLPKETLAQPGIKSGLFNQVSAESGYTFSSNQSPKDKPDLMKHDSLYGETDLYGNYIYEHLGLKFNLSKRIELNLEYNYLNFSKTKYIQYARWEDHFEATADSAWGTYYRYSYPRVTYDTNFQYRINQHEFHAGLSFYLNGGFRIMPAFHMIHVSYPVTTARVSFQEVQDTGYYIAATKQWVFFPFNRTLYTFDRRDTSFSNYLFSLALSKEIGRFNLGISGSWSNINNRKQKQIGMTLTWMPWGNLNFYSTTSAIGFFQKGGNRILLSETIGTKITPWCWGEASFHYGDFTNANIMNGSVVYNSSDVIDYRAGANLYFLAGKNLQLYLVYQYVKKESQTYYYTSGSTSGEMNTQLKTELVPYHFNTIMGGLIWKF